MVSQSFPFCTLKYPYHVSYLWLLLFPWWIMFHTADSYELYLKIETNDLQHMVISFGKVKFMCELRDRSNFWHVCNNSRTERRTFCKAEITAQKLDEFIWTIMWWKLRILKKTSKLPHCSISSESDSCLNNPSEKPKQADLLRIVQCIF